MSLIPYLERFTPNNAWILILVGLFLGLLGYRLYRIAVFIAGILLGLTLGGEIGQAIGDSSLGLVLGLVLGLAFGVMANFMVRFSLFLIGAVGGWALSAWVLPYTAIPMDSIEQWLWTLGIALVGGFLSMALYRFIAIAMTSLLGAYLIYEVVILWLPESRLIWLPFIILFAVFLAVQISSIRGRPHLTDRAWRKHYRH